MEDNFVRPVVDMAELIRLRANHLESERLENERLEHEAVGIIDDYLKGMLPRLVEQFKLAYIKCGTVTPFTGDIFLNKNLSCLSDESVAGLKEKYGLTFTRKHMCADGYCCRSASSRILKNAVSVTILPSYFGFIE